MSKDPLDAVYAFVERAYIRLQTGEVLNQCLEKEDTAPIQALVEELVLSGPSGLEALRQTLIEVGARKTKVQEELGGDSRENLDSLRRNLLLLEEIEVYLQDWLWGLIYQFTRQEWAQALATSQKTKWPH